MKIDSHTRILGIFGYPLAHTASPAMHNSAFETLSLNHVYLPFEVKPEDLPTAVKGLVPLNFLGGNVTIPHKQAIMPLLDEISPHATTLNAVNTIVAREGRLVGDNTDGEGFLRALKEDHGFCLDDKKMVLIGAGGAGSAVALTAAAAGIRSIAICDIETVRARKLVDAVSKLEKKVVVHQSSPEDDTLRNLLEQADILVNATPVGLHGDDQPPLPSSFLRKRLFVYDLIYSPPVTRLMEEARHRGCRVSNGLGMLLYQGVKAFEIWTGKEAPVRVMRESLEQAVYRFGGVRP